MYLRILSALTVTFLAVLFLVMVQTVPSATTMTTAGEFLPLIKVNCSPLSLAKEISPRHI